MNSLDISILLLGLFLLCFSNPHSRRLYGNHFSTLSLLLLLFYMHPFSLHAHPPSSLCKL
ncbi:hypothetical protein F5H01DRAFT_346060, partial [Linnemannia elongata]